MCLLLCPDCGEAMDHCHGTLVSHAGDTAECTDPGCVDPVLANHTLVVTCGDVDGNCVPCAGVLTPA